MINKYMKLSDYAKLNGVCYRTAYNWFHAGLIPGAKQLATGTIIIDQAQDVNKPTRVVTYSRVSNASRRKELVYQVDRINVFCVARGMQVDKTYKEVASGMNDTRKQLWAMIDSNPTTIVIENKDRLSRFGFNYLEKLLAKQGTTIIVINRDITDENDLMRDLVSIITSFCCRLYGLRRGVNRAKKIQNQINDNTEI